MKPLEMFVQSPLARAVGWTLLHSFWEGAVIAALLGAALSILRSPRARYAAGCLAMLALVGCFSFTLIRMIPAVADTLQRLRPLEVPAWQIGTITGVARPWAPTLAAIAPWLAPFWIAGVLIFCLRHLAGLASVHGLRRRGVCCAPERWQRELARLSAGLRLSGPILLLESCLADAPVVLGHFCPLILMPVGLLAGLPSGQIEAILLHELAHIRRHDYLANVLQRLAESLLFYHPAVWWISRVIRVERENCCDDLVVATRGNAREYALALAALEQSRWPDRVPVVAATGGSLVKRIRRLLYPGIKNGVGAPFLAAVLLIGCATVALAVWHSKPLDRKPVAAQQQMDSAAYSRWLNEDVIYIISAEERSAFQKLTTDEERDKFIEQFWLRRDPTPGTPENEFKEEHYRRIAYANDHWTMARKLGWQTDRGHMYIRYGPPDEIDSHPSANPHPFEDWAYRNASGAGDLFLRFVDKTGQGDYQLVPDNNR